MEENVGMKASPVRLQDKHCKEGGKECGTVDERAKQRRVARKKYRSSSSRCDVEVHSIPTRRPDMLLKLRNICLCKPGRLYCYKARCFYRQDMLVDRPLFTSPHGASDLRSIAGLPIEHHLEDRSLYYCNAIVQHCSIVSDSTMGFR